MLSSVVRAQVVRWSYKHSANVLTLAELQGNARRLFALQKRFRNLARGHSAAKPTVITGLALLRLGLVLLQDIECESDHV